VVHKGLLFQELCSCPTEQKITKWCSKSNLLLSLDLSYKPCYYSSTNDTAEKKTDSIQKWSTLYGKDYQDAYHKGLDKEITRDIAQQPLVPS